MVQFELTDFSHKGVNNNKKQIVLADSKRDLNNYVQSLRFRYNKKNPYLPNYVISKNGDIYTIMEPAKYSNFLQNDEVDKNSIIIVLENLGSLRKIPMQDYHINWIGDIYKKKVFERKWRDEYFWDPYEKIQLESLSKLTKNLCKEFQIPIECIGHNVKQEGIEFFQGVVSRSNYDIDFKDVNPAFNFKLFKELLEND